MTVQYPPAFQPNYVEIFHAPSSLAIFRFLHYVVLHFFVALCTPVLLLLLLLLLFTAIELSLGGSSPYASNK